MDRIVYESNNDIFKEQLKWIMDHEHLTATEVAKKTGINRQTIKRYVSGYRAPNVRDALWIFECLGYEFQIYKIGNNSNRPDDLWKNASGYRDKTAFKAIKKADAERERYEKLMNAISAMCELSGFSIEARPELKDVKTGKVWK